MVGIDDVCTLCCSGNSNQKATEKYIVDHLEKNNDDVFQVYNNFYTDPYHLFDIMYNNGNIEIAFNEHRDLVFCDAVICGPKMIEVTEF